MNEKTFISETKHAKQILKATNKSPDHTRQNTVSDLEIQEQK